MYLQDKVKREPVHATPMTFTALMDMYEQNYLMLRVLCGEFPEAPAQAVSVGLGKAQNLYLYLLESTPHTVTVKLTYRFGENENRPDLLIRIYRDAQQAEVLSRKCRISGKKLFADNGVSDTALYCRWRLNRFLFKWLRYCQRQGHSFTDTDWSVIG